MNSELPEADIFAQQLGAELSLLLCSTKAQPKTTRLATARKLRRLAIRNRRRGLRTLATRQVNLAQAVIGTVPRTSSSA